MDTIITAICSNEEPQPILPQILLKFVSTINNPEWVRWSESVGAMPNLHWYWYTFLERIFNCFTDFATDFGNGNIMSESRPIAELNTKTLVGVLTVMKAFLTQINLHQATMLPITISQSGVATYNISPWNNTQSCGRPLGAKSASDAKPSPEQRRGDKRNPTTPDMANDTNSSNRQKQKKPKKGMKVDTAAKERKDLGMFYLKNPSINPSKFFRKSCQRRSTHILPARERSAAMLHATSFIPGSHTSSNSRPSSQLLIISTRTTLVGSMSTIL